jgi:hypothetical protein
MLPLLSVSVTNSNVILCVACVVAFLGFVVYAGSCHCSAVTHWLLGAQPQIQSRVTPREIRRG